MKNHAQNYVEANGARFPRSTCMNCGEPSLWLGEAISIVLAEGGFAIIHRCMACLRRANLSVTRGETAGHTREEARAA